MKWFRHDSDARSDAKIEKLMIKYGVDGYGLYFYCVEIIAGNLSAEHITFELEHDAETIAYRLKMDTLRVEEIMLYMVKAGLFDINPTTNRIVCMSLARRLDNHMIRNLEIRKVAQRSDNVVSTQPQRRPSEQIRLEETRRDKKEKKVNVSRIKDIEAIVRCLNKETNSNFRPMGATKEVIEHRLDEGYEKKDLVRVVIVKADQWMGDEKMQRYLRPMTLFGKQKFPGYLAEYKREEEE